MGWRIRRALSLVLAGVAMILAGFVYGVLFAGIPYQDPTPELAAAYARHDAVASALAWSGLAMIVIGTALGIARFLLRRGPP